MTCCTAPQQVLKFPSKHPHLFCAQRVCEWYGVDGQAVRTAGSCRDTHVCLGTAAASACMVHAAGGRLRARFYCGGRLTPESWTIHESDKPAHAGSPLLATTRHDKYAGSHDVQVHWAAARGCQPDGAAHLSARMSQASSNRQTFEQS